MVKVREDMTGWAMKEHGFPNSKLTVIKQVGDYVDSSGMHYAMYRCVCDCSEHNHINVRASNLRQGITQSCGCIHKEIVSLIGSSNKQYNQYDLSGDYGIGWTSNTNKEFYFDLEDYDIIKNYCWNEHKLQGKKYSALEARDQDAKKVIRMSWILGCKDYDHINRNTFDNRRCNLRKCTDSDNIKNRGKLKSNTSGFTGVHFDDKHQLWIARINDRPYHRIVVYSGSDKQDAIKARLEAEAKYYGEFAPQKNLFNEYGIEVNIDE